MSRRFQVNRISNRQRRRNEAAAQSEAANARVLLFAIIGQLGGELAVTRGTIEQAISLVLQGRASIAVVDGANENERIVRIVNG
jgi:hypothetical protein